MRFTGCATLLLLLFAAPLPAQDVVAVLKGEEGQGFYRRSIPLVLWNGYWVIREEGSNLHLYDAETGDFVQHLGREGQGPMEWRSPVDALVVGDSLYVVDVGNVRVSVVGPDLKLVRDFRMQARAYDIEMIGSRLVVAATFHDRDRAGRAVFFTRPVSDAPVADGFDEYDIIPIEGGIRGRREITVYDDRITTLRIDGLLRTYDMSGTLLAEVTPEKPSGWMTSVLDHEYLENQSDKDVLRPGYVNRLMPAGDGLVWVGTSFPREDWRDRLREVEGKYYLDPADSYRAQVDLIDPMSGEVRQSVELGEALISFVDGGYVASSRYDDLDRQTITIRRLPDTREESR